MLQIYSFFSGGMVLHYCVSLASLNLLACREWMDSGWVGFWVRHNFNLSNVVQDARTSQFWLPIVATANAAWMRRTLQLLQVAATSDRVKRAPRYSCPYHRQNSGRSVCWSPWSLGCGRNRTAERSPTGSDATWPVGYALLLHRYYANGNDKGIKAHPAHMCTTCDANDIGKSENTHYRRFQRFSGTPSESPPVSCLWSSAIRRRPLASCHERRSYRCSVSRRCMATRMEYKNGLQTIRYSVTKYSDNNEILLWISCFLQIVSIYRCILIWLFDCRKHRLAHTGGK